MLSGIQLQRETSFWHLRILFGVEWFSRSLCTTGLTELLWFVWCLFVCFTVKNPTLARKILLRVTVAEKQLEPWSPRSNSKLIPYNWEQKWLFSFWVAAELTELVISAEGSIPCAHHPSVFTQQLVIFCLSTECMGQWDSRLVFSVAIILHNLQPLKLSAFNERYVTGLSFSPHLEFSPKQDKLSG